MTIEEVKNLVILIQAYYPSKKIFDNEIEELVWADELKDFDKELTIEAVKRICRNTKNAFNVNIATIREEYFGLKRELKEKEEQQRILEEMSTPKREMTKEEMDEIDRMVEKAINNLKAR